MEGKGREREKAKFAKGTSCLRAERWMCWVERPLDMLMIVDSRKWFGWGGV